MTTVIDMRIICIGLVINTYEQIDAGEVIVTPQRENVPSILQYFVILWPLQSTSCGLGKGLFNSPLLNNGRVHLEDGGDPLNRPFKEEFQFRMVQRIRVGNWGSNGPLKAKFMD